MNQEKIPQNKRNNRYDTIIIGSGAGGLSAGICLSRAGKKVLVLEQHDVPGGWCHSFYLKGQRFTPGVHYVGLLGKGESSNDLFRGLGIANDLVFFRMNPDAYEHLRIGEERFDFPANPEKLIDRLCQRFPKETKEIHKYIRLLQKVNEELNSLPYIKGFWQKLTIPFRTKHFGKYGLFSVRRVINWHLKNPLLKNILNIQCGDHGVQPSKAAFVFHSALMCHYIHGGYYPMNGGGAIIKAMTNAIKKNDGVISTSTMVKRILLEGLNKKKAIGVELANGEKFYANQIISNADVGITYNDLIGKENLSKKLQKKLEKTIYSCSSVMLFLIVAMDVRQAGLDSGNIWVMPDKDTDTYYDQAMRSDLTSDAAFEGMFISCTTLKDPPSFDGKHHTIEVIIYINYKAFEKFKAENEERSPEYLAFKEHVTKKMLKGLEKVIPGIKKHIVHQDLGTPITNDHYINTTDGNVYGTEKSLKHIGPFAYKSKSEIENLYLCGASILSHGVIGACNSGVNTAALILGCDSDELREPEEDQFLQIYEAEDASEYPDWLVKKIATKKARFAAKSKTSTIVPLNT